VAEDAERATLDPSTRAVLDALAEVDVTETPPVELMAKVQEWQERLDDPTRDGADDGH
jgi:DNA mismatch repair protein MutS